MPYIGNVPAESYSQVSYQDLTGGSGTSFTLDYAVGSAGEIEVFVNNVRQEPTVAYTVSGTSLTMTGSIAATDDFYVVFQGKAQQTIGIPEKQTDGTYLFGDSVTINADLTVDTNTLHVDSANNRVGVGTASPAAKLHLGGSSNQTIQMEGASNTAYFGTNGNRGDLFVNYDPTNGTIPNSGRSTVGIQLDGADGGSNIVFRTTNANNAASSERARIDSSGNLLVGKTAQNSDNAGVELRAGGQTTATRSASWVGLFNRLTDDGDIVRFQKDNTTVGSIGSVTGNVYFATKGGSNQCGIAPTGGSDPRVIPCNATGSAVDNGVDLGYSNARWDDIWATNGTIQTSDQNEKQQIAVLTDAEIAAAKAISKLFKTFKWNDSVAEKNDAARTHAGVIAQDVQQAMIDAGLDAGDYAFFISTTWWEADETYTDDDGVEQTRTNTYDTLEEAPAEATERTRLGIRYPELLAFIGAATEQRLTSIEARLDALETP